MSKEIDVFIRQACRQIRWFHLRRQSFFLPVECVTFVIYIFCRLSFQLSAMLLWYSCAHRCRLRILNLDGNFLNSVPELCLLTPSAQPGGSIQRRSALESIIEVKTPSAEPSVRAPSQPGASTDQNNTPAETSTQPQDAVATSGSPAPDQLSENTEQPKDAAVAAMTEQSTNGKGKPSLTGEKPVQVEVTSPLTVNASNDASSPVMMSTGEPTATEDDSIAMTEIIPAPPNTYREDSSTTCPDVSAIGTDSRQQMSSQARVDDQATPATQEEPPESVEKRPENEEALTTEHPQNPANVHQSHPVGESIFNRGTYCASTGYGRAPKVLVMGLSCCVMLSKI